MLLQEHINDVRAEGKGRGIQRPRKRLKFKNIPMVVLLLFLLLTDYSNMAKIIAGRQK